MFIGTVVPIETLTVSVEGDELETVDALVAELMPEHWQAVAIELSISPHESVLRAEATFARLDGQSEVQGQDMTELRSAVPDGFQLLYVRRE